ncbi:MAG: hypothetical protein M4579_000437 [Chaenotheca gracillima]|nr:MAG: hypothetical protein M4579_000437 [Chaenotheca gracillima]
MVAGAAAHEPAQPDSGISGATAVPPATDNLKIRLSEPLRHGVSGLPYSSLAEGSRARWDSGDAQRPSAPESAGWDTNRPSTTLSSRSSLPPQPLHCDLALRENRVAGSLG